MLHIYDDAIVEDLKKSFNQDEYGNCVVSVVKPEDVLSIAAQVQDDKIHYPLVALSREDNIPIDSDRMNFTRLHTGVATVFDKKSNMIYYEKVVPIKLQYTLACIATNTADVDEMIRELFFKYTSQYFITLQIPYESKRKIRCGLRIDPNDNIEQYSTTSNYLQEGKLHSAGVTLHVDGAVMVHYTPQHLRRFEFQTDTSLPPTGNQ
jgi:hypothetical protein